MDDSATLVEIPALAAERIKAIESYTQLEYALSMLIATTLNIDHRQAFTIISRMVNARSRCALVSDMIALSDIAECRPFWRGIEKIITEIDGVRNKIVHWIQASTNGPLDSDGKQTVASYYLMPWKTFNSAGSDKLTIEDIREYCVKVGTASNWVSMLSGYALANSEIRAAERAVFTKAPTPESSEELQKIIHNLIEKQNESLRKSDSSSSNS
ncbi:hypothetical protein Plav_2826 [Parvibaculum lavamentivorans DS-1]|uniref:Uncharacterized protein n=1 Tax=Parvibaculum lavamentivorans (strain DS-1 / DSM 13023 / NCIMB 13966) TaxID=402881 RepID=A7HX00_PARL1|nr:hypothetical protein [Parvibaculum lavamentivorans]ABS64433.1 hypothetical protein Plav_2826 [Parvibaculum lavamentivorans DS-1]